MCSTVSQAPNPVQWQITTSTAALPPVNSITTTNQAGSPSVNNSKTTVNKTASSDGHGNTDYTPCYDKQQDTTPHSTLQNDDGHIHRASPIRSLPLESSLNDSTMVSQHISDGTTEQHSTESSPNKLNLPMAPTAGDKARSDRTELRHGQSATRAGYRCQGQPLGKQEASSTDSNQKLNYTNPNVDVRLTGIPQHQEAASQSIELAPVNRPFLHRYDMRLCLQQDQKQALSEWEALTNLFSRLATIDETIVLHPWKSTDSASQPTIQLSSESSGFFDLDTYAPQLVSFKWLDSPIRQSALFLGSTVTPALLSQQLGPWLKTTQQGLWPRQLPLVEQTVCLGWLLFSAPEYNVEELRRTILAITGVRVALRYRRIRDTLPKQVAGPPSTVKAIHIEVDTTTTQNQ